MGLAGNFNIQVLKPPKIVFKKVSSIIRNSISSIELKNLRKIKNVLIIAPDNTRKTHLREILTELLRLRGFSGKKVSVLFANGLHRRMDEAQIKWLVGEKLFSKLDFFNHSLAREDIKKLGVTKAGIPITLNRRLFESDFIISIGVVEPHLYAGFSGGPKTIAIGLSGKDTIDKTHHPRFLDNPNVNLGVVKNNPFNRMLWEIVRHVRVGLAINILNDSDGNLIYCFTGRLEKVYKEATRKARLYFNLKVKEMADVVICGLGGEKAQNAYQASRAFNYVINTKRTILKKGGLILTIASLGDGFGNGIGEIRFEEVIKNMKVPDYFISRVKAKGCVAGEHRAYMVAKALRFARLGFVTENPLIFRKTPFLAFRSLKEACIFIEREISKNPRIAIIPNIFSVIATLDR
jgi:nickel-dependent lactate racemase